MREKPPLRFYTIIPRVLYVAWRKSSDGLWSVNGEIKHWHLHFSKSDKYAAWAINLIWYDRSYWIGGPR